MSTKIFIIFFKNLDLYFQCISSRNQVYFFMRVASRVNGSVILIVEAEVQLKDYDILLF